MQGKDRYEDMIGRLAFTHLVDITTTAEDLKHILDNESNADLEYLTIIDISYDKDEKLMRIETMGDGPELLAPMSPSEYGAHVVDTFTDLTNLRLPFSLFYSPITEETTQEEEENFIKQLNTLINNSMRQYIW